MPTQKHSFPQGLWATVCVLIFCVSSFAQRGAITRAQNLSELADEAAVIVRGFVVSAVVEPHPEFRELSTVVVTLRIEETLKGTTGATLTFRQYIWDVRDQRDAAGYKKGQHLLLLLTRPSAYGLSSPTGLEQGRFRVLRDPAGNLMAVNGNGNATLFHQLGPRLKSKGVQLPSRLARMIEQQPSGPIPLDDLRALIQQIVGAQ